MIREEIEKRMDELARKYVETRDKKIIEELYELTCQLGKMEKRVIGLNERLQAMVGCRFATAVEALRGVALKRACPQTGVGLRRSDPRQRERENERNYKDGKTRSSVSRMLKHIEPSLF
jgi:hypothetical protein